MKRVVQPEWLDTLQPDDPRAVRSRRDLCRVNAWMGNPALMARAVRDAANGRAPGVILDLGAGDGDFLLRVARRVDPAWPGVKARLLDRRNVVAAETLKAFAGAGWRAETVISDVFAWAQDPAAPPADVVIANLFLHHFTNGQLTELLRRVGERAQCFVALEPRRGLCALLGSRWLWLIGCNAVTQYDAIISVRAGFAGRELSALWPVAGGWQLTERRAGLFSHLFIAQRIG